MFMEPRQIQARTPISQMNQRRPRCGWYPPRACVPASDILSPQMRRVARGLGLSFSRAHPHRSSSQATPTPTREEPPQEEPPAGLGCHQQPFSCPLLTRRPPGWEDTLEAAARP